MTNEIKIVSVIGLGFMGKQIAGRTALYDYTVRIYDVKTEGLDKFARSLTRKKKRLGVSGDVPRLTPPIGPMPRRLAWPPQIKDPIGT